MFRPIALVVMVIATLLSGARAWAGQPLPIAFGENIVADSSGVGVEFQFFDPSRTPDDNIVNANILQFPTNLGLFSGSAASQSCAFFGVCGFFTAGFIGTDQLVYRIGSAIQDNGETVFSLPAMVTIEIVASIEQSIAFEQNAGTYRDTPVPIRPGGTAPGNATLRYTIVDAPQNGTLDSTSASSPIRTPVVYTPEQGFIGVDEFTFTVTDGITLSEPATITIDVLDPDAPVITSIRPATGAATGGNDVTISGVNLTPDDIEVAFGNAVVTSPIIEVSESTLQFTTPPNEVGVVDVQISTSLGDSTLVGGFIYEPPVTGLVSAVLPAARSVQVGEDATAFGVIVNAGNTKLSDCGLAPVTPIDGEFAYQETDAETNALTGTENIPVDIPARGAQTFVFRFTPDTEVAPTDIELAFECAGEAIATSSTGVNTLLLSASAEPVPDVIAVVAVDSGALPPGTLGLDAQNTGAFFAVATTNIGAAGTITVETDTDLPLTINTCETAEDCLAGSAAELTTEMAANSVGSFFFLVESSAEIPFRPETSRLFVRFKDESGVIRGSTSLAVTTD